MIFKERRSASCQGENPSENRGDKMLTSGRRKNRSGRWGVFLLILLALTTAAVASSSTLDPELFPVPSRLEANVAFWTKVYSTYESDKVLLHDDLYLNVIYAVLDFSKLEQEELSEGKRRVFKKREIDKAKAKYRSILQDLAAGRSSELHADEQVRVAVLFASLPGKDKAKYTAAISRLRTQTCLRDRFAEGIERSGLYLSQIETVFERHGLPLALTRLPFVESLFQTNARSSARAGGIWQFIPATARLYLKMGLELDQRFDPLRATEAAAQLLKKNHADLGTWPLAVTAYNHGTNGMKRAVRSLGTRDFGTIVEKYRSRTFGFASRNFYSELIAATQVYEDRARIFPGVSPKPSLISEAFVPEHYVSLRDLAHHAEISLDDLRQRNPAFSSQIWSGNLYLPKGYPLLVPTGSKAAIEAAYSALPDDRKSPHQIGFRYRVRPGDTLASIAARFGSSVRVLQRANGVRNPHRIRIGDRLLIPPGRGVKPPPTTPAQAMVTAQQEAVQEETASEPLSHAVRKGETLTQIAARYQTSVEALQAANQLRSADHLQPGQRLVVPTSGRTHVVRSGETLAMIARKYSTTVRAIQDANRIKSHIIQPRQVLAIPCLKC